MNIYISNIKHKKFADQISKCIDESAKMRGTGIARRTPEYITKKIEAGNAVIALDKEEFAGFCYIERWGHGKYVNLSKKKYPDSKVFGITTSKSVMRINVELGYRPVPFSELTDDPEFWKGCRTCVNYDILTRTDKKMCLCTGMLNDKKK